MKESHDKNPKIKYLKLLVEGEPVFVRDNTREELTSGQPDEMSHKV